MNLHFIRLYTTYECPDYYERLTDVWVFGDVEGYRYFQTLLQKAKSSTENIYYRVDTQSSNGMHVAILPAAKDTSRGPRLKLIERIVFLDDLPSMELVIYGNSPGYDRFMSLVKRVISRGTDKVYVNEQIRDSMNWVVKRSVAINMRGPLISWSLEALEPSTPYVQDRQPTYIPTDIEYMTREDNPYEEISAESSFLSLD